MRTNKLFCGFLVATSLMMFGCSSTENGKNTNSQNANQSNSQTVTKTTQQSSQERQNSIKRSIEQSSQQMTPEIKALLNKQDDLNAIVKSEKIEDCKKLDGANYQESCQVYILANKAKNNTDLAVCDKAANETVKSHCQFVVKNK